MLDVDIRQPPSDTFSYAPGHVGKALIVRTDNLFRVIVA
jgi:hypothetical protein